jgi:hypothetical protein
MRVAQWIKLSVGALDNKGVPKLAGCLKHQLQTGLILHSFSLSSNMLVNFYACGSLDWAQC